MAEQSRSKQGGRDQLGTTPNHTDKPGLHHQSEAGPSTHNQPLPPHHLDRKNTHKSDNEETAHVMSYATRNTTNEETDKDNHYQDTPRQDSRPHEHRPVSVSWGYHEDEDEDYINSLRRRESETHLQHVDRILLGHVISHHTGSKLLRLSSRPELPVPLDPPPAIPREEHFPSTSVERGESPSDQRKRRKETEEKNERKKKGDEKENLDDLLRSGSESELAFDVESVSSVTSASVTKAGEKSSPLSSGAEATRQHGHGSVNPPPAAGLKHQQWQPEHYSEHGHHRSHRDHTQQQQQQQHQRQHNQQQQRLQKQQQQQHNQQRRLQQQQHQQQHNQQQGLQQQQQQQQQQHNQQQQGLQQQQQRQQQEEAEKEDRSRDRRLSMLSTRSSEGHLFKPTLATEPPPQILPSSKVPAKPRDAPHPDPPTRTTQTRVLTVDRHVQTATPPVDRGVQTSTPLLPSPPPGGVSVNDPSLVPLHRSRDPPQEDRDGVSSDSADHVLSPSGQRRTKSGIDLRNPGIDQSTRGVATNTRLTSSTHRHPSPPPHRRHPGTEKTNLVAWDTEDPPGSHPAERGRTKPSVRFASEKDSSSVVHRSTNTVLVDDETVGGDSAGATVIDPSTQDSFFSPVDSRTKPSVRFAREKVTNSTSNPITTDAVRVGGGTTFNVRSTGTSVVDPSSSGGDVSPVKDRTKPRVRVASETDSNTITNPTTKAVQVDSKTSLNDSSTGAIVVDPSSTEGNVSQIKDKTSVRFASGGGTNSVTTSSTTPVPVDSKTTPSGRGPDTTALDPSTFPGSHALRVNSTSQPPVRLAGGKDTGGVVTAATIAHVGSVDKTTAGSSDGKPTRALVVVSSQGGNAPQHRTRTKSVRFASDAVTDSTSCATAKTSLPAVRESVTGDTGATTVTKARNSAHHRRLSQGDSEKRNYNPGDSEKRNYNPGDSEKRNYNPGDSKKRNYNPGDREKRNYNPGDSEKRNYNPGDREKRNYNPGDSEKRNYNPGDREKRNYNPGDSEKRNYNPGDSEKRNYNPGDSSLARSQRDSRRGAAVTVAPLNSNDRSERGGGGGGGGGIGGSGGGRTSNNSHSSPFITDTASSRRHKDSAPPHNRDFPLPTHHHHHHHPLRDVSTRRDRDGHGSGDKDRPASKHGPPTAVKPGAGASASRGDSSDGREARKDDGAVQASSATFASPALHSKVSRRERLGDGELPSAHSRGSMTQTGRQGKGERVSRNLHEGTHTKSAEDSGHVGEYRRADRREKGGTMRRTEPYLPTSTTNAADSRQTLAVPGETEDAVPSRQRGHKAGHPGNADRPRSKFLRETTPLPQHHGEFTHDSTDTPQHHGSDREKARVRREDPADSGSSGLGLASSDADSDEALLRQSLRELSAKVQLRKMEQDLARSRSNHTWSDHDPDSEYPTRRHRRRSRNTAPGVVSSSVKDPGVAMAEGKAEPPPGRLGFEPENGDSRTVAGKRQGVQSKQEVDVQSTAEHRTKAEYSNAEDSLQDREFYIDDDFDWMGDVEVETVYEGGDTYVFYLQTEDGSIVGPLRFDVEGLDLGLPVPSEPRSESEPTGNLIFAFPTHFQCVLCSTDRRLSALSCRLFVIVVC